MHYTAMYIGETMTRQKKQQYRHLPAFILLALADGPMHGGGIYTAITANMPNLNADSGAVYRTLQKLELEGEVEFNWDTSNSGPARKVYQLTDGGWAKLALWKGEIESRVANLNYFLSKYNSVQK